MYVRYFQDCVQCPHYSGCPYFKGVCKAGFQCNIIAGIPLYPVKMFFVFPLGVPWLWFIHVSGESIITRRTQQLAVWEDGVSCTVTRRSITILTSSNIWHPLPITSNLKLFCCSLVCCICVVLLFVAFTLAYLP